MHVNLKVITCNDYFSQVGRKIYWNENDKSKVQVKQADEINKILATEVSIHLLRDATGICGSLIDTMVGIRRELIKKYETNYETYIEYNDFY